MHAATNDTTRALFFASRSFSLSCVGGVVVRFLLARSRCTLTNAADDTRKNRVFLSDSWQIPARFMTPRLRSQPNPEQTLERQNSNHFGVFFVPLIH